jgi:hypothetical protein
VSFGDAWKAEASAIVKLLLAAGALAVVIREAHVRGRAGAPTAGRPWQRRHAQVLAVFGVVGGLAYFNFGAFHFGGRYVHLWDTFHHYLGAKYAEELGYDGLYACVTVSDAAEPGGQSLAAQRRITDLVTHETSRGSDVLAHPEGCLSRFRPERWRAFKADVSFFRRRFPPDSWQSITNDHGFNASPVWLLVARPLVGDDALSETRLIALTLLDPALMILAFAIAAWAFGGTPAALVAVVWGTYFPARLWWTGGSFLRWDWLAATLIGVSLCRRERYAAGGVALAYAALSRVFPGFALLGLLLKTAVVFARRRRLERASGRVLMGATVAAALLSCLAAAVGPAHVWSRFGHNLATHSATPSPNRMGMATLVAFHPSTRHRVLASDHDDRERWERAQARNLQRRRALWIAAAVVVVGALAFAVESQPVWAAALVGLIAVPFGPALACYYYAFVALLPLLGERRVESAGIVLVLVLSSGAVARLTRYEMDEQYAAQSLLAVVAFIALLTSFVRIKATET